MTITGNTISAAEANCRTGIYAADGTSNIFCNNNHFENVCPDIEDSSGAIVQTQATFSCGNKDATDIDFRHLPKFGH
jgi:hypothetical protein